MDQWTTLLYLTIDAVWNIGAPFALVIAYRFHVCCPFREPFLPNGQDILTLDPYDTAEELTTYSDNLIQWTAVKNTTKNGHLILVKMCGSVFQNIYFGYPSWYADNIWIWYIIYYPIYHIWIYNTIQLSFLSAMQVRIWFGYDIPYIGTHENNMSASSHNLHMLNISI